MKSFFVLALLTFSLTGCNRAPVPAPVSAPTNSQPVAAAPIPAPTPAPPVDDRLPEALKLKETGKPLEARALLQELATNDQASAALGELNTQIIFTALPAPEKVDYTIQTGDTLGKLATKYGGIVS